MPKKLKEIWKNLKPDEKVALIIATAIGAVEFIAEGKSVEEFLNEDILKS